MKIETILIALLIGILLYCFCRKMSIEGFLDPRCENKDHCAEGTFHGCFSGKDPACDVVPPCPPGQDFVNCGDDPGPSEQCDKILQRECAEEESDVFNCAECAKKFLNKGCDATTISDWCAISANCDTDPPWITQNGYIQIKNDTHKQVKVWFDLATQGGEKYLKVKGEGGVYFKSTCASEITGSENGYQLDKDGSIFIKFKRNDIWTSFGMWFTDVNDINGKPIQNSHAPPNVTRFEITKSEDLPDQIWFNNSYVDGFNAIINYQLFQNKDKTTLLNQSKPCNLFVNTRKDCEDMGGKCKRETAGKVGGVELWSCTNPKFWVNKKLGLDYGTGDLACAKPDGNTCGCLESWYNTYPGPNQSHEWPKCSGKTCPRLWYETIRDKCPSAYSWAYAEKDPTDISNPIFNDPDINPHWCPTNPNYDNAKIQGELVEERVFKDSDALEHVVLPNKTDDPIIIVSINHLWDATNCV